MHICREVGADSACCRIDEGRLLAVNAVDLMKQVWRSVNQKGKKFRVGTPTIGVSEASLPLEFLPFRVFTRGVSGVPLARRVLSSAERCCNWSVHMLLPCQQVLFKRSKMRKAKGAKIGLGCS
jgi:hypothetical protein